MAKIADYSGEFNPDLKLGDLSPEAFEKMVKTYAELYKALDGFWYLAVMNHRGNNEALDYDIQVWEKLCYYEMKKITRQFNIQGKDIKSFLKAFQLTPWAWNLKSKFELISDNHCIWTVTSCPTVDALEKEDRGRENDICNNVEIRILKRYASYFNPDIKVTCLKTPPRENKNDIYCKWDMKLT